MFEFLKDLLTGNEKKGALPLTKLPKKPKLVYKKIKTGMRMYRVKWDNYVIMIILGTILAVNIAAFLIALFWRG